MLKKRFIAIRGAFLAVLIVLMCICASHCDADESLLYPVDQMEGLGFSPQGGMTISQWHQHAHKFAMIWRKRAQGDITPYLIPFLNDPSIGLRIFAAQGIGFLEHPSGEKALAKKLTTWSIWEAQVRASQRRQANARKFQSQDELRLIPQYILKSSLGRIRARRLTGRQKLDRIAREFGLDYNGIVSLSQKVQQRLGNRLLRTEVSQSPAYSLIVSFVNIVHGMGKRGGEIAPLHAERLTKSIVLKMVLKAASLSATNETKLFLNFATSQDGGRFPPSYLLNSESNQLPLLFERLRVVASNPNMLKFGKGDYSYGGLETLIIAARQSGDNRAVPILQSLANSANKRVSFLARKIVHDLDSGDIADFRAWQ